MSDFSVPKIRRKREQKQTDKGMNPGMNVSPDGSYPNNSGGQQHSMMSNNPENFD